MLILKNYIEIFCGDPLKVINRNKSNLVFIALDLTARFYYFHMYSTLTICRLLLLIIVIDMLMIIINPLGQYPADT